MGGCLYRFCVIIIFDLFVWGWFGHYCVWHMVSPAILSLIHLRWCQPTYTLFNSCIEQIYYRKKIFYYHPSIGLHPLYLPYFHRTPHLMSSHLPFHYYLPLFPLSYPLCHFHHPCALYFPGTDLLLGHHYLWCCYCHSLYYLCLIYLHLFYK